MDHADHPAIPLLKSFMADMNCWEVKFHALMSQNIAAHAPQAIAELKPIFDRYLADDATGLDRLVQPAPQQPPAYDPTHEEVTGVEDRRNGAVIQTRSDTGFKNEYRYTMVVTDGRWAIKKKEVFRFSKDKWVKYNI